MIVVTPPAAAEARRALDALARRAAGVHVRVDVPGQDRAARRRRRCARRPVSSPGAGEHRDAAVRDADLALARRPPGSAKRPLTTRSSIAGVYAPAGVRSCREPARPVVQVDTEHPSALRRVVGALARAAAAAARDRLRPARRGRPLPRGERPLRTRTRSCISGSSAPWAAHDPAALDRLGEVVVASGRPVLGICAGMQLLGRFAGGRIDHAAEPEIGELEVEVDRARRALPGRRRSGRACGSTTPTS